MIGLAIFKKKMEICEGHDKIANFEFNRSTKNMVFVKTSIETAAQQTTMTENTELLTEFPQKTKTQRVKQQKKKYLFKKIRPFCEEECKELLCPNPGDPV